MRKAQHKGKRVLASALCVGMLASMVPTQAFAADEQPVAAVVQEAAPAAEEAPAEDAVSTETPAEESAAEETPAPAEDAPTEETPVEEAPAEEAALAPMDAPVEEALAAEETAAPAAQEAAAPQTAAARIATNVGVVPAGIDWADNVTANTFAEPYATVTAKDSSEQRLHRHHERQRRYTQAGPRCERRRLQCRGRLRLHGHCRNAAQQQRQHL